MATDRVEAFRKLIDESGWQPTDYDEGEEEDPRPYLDGREKPARFVCVTTNYSSHGSEKTFFLPTFDSAEDAQERATRFARDDLFEELPMAVVDLDTGAVYEPDWRSIKWSYKAPVE